MKTQSTACNFAAHEKYVNAGAKTELKGWWKAAEECISNKRFHKKNGTPNVVAYAKEAAIVSYKNRKLNDDKYFSFNTIQQQVNACVKAIMRGNKMSEFASVQNVKDTYANKGVRVVAPVKKNADAKAYEAIMATKEYKALPAKARKAIALLAKGEAFSTVSL